MGQAPDRHCAKLALTIPIKFRGSLLLPIKLGHAQPRPSGASRQKVVPFQKPRFWDFGLDSSSFGLERFPRRNASRGRCSGAPLRPIRQYFGDFRRDMTPLWSSSPGTVRWCSCAHFMPCTVDDEHEKCSDHTQNILRRFGCAASVKSARKDGVPRAAKSTIRTVVPQPPCVVVWSLSTIMRDTVIMRRACVQFVRLGTENEARTPTLPTRGHYWVLEGTMGFVQVARDAFSL